MIKLADRPVPVYHIACNADDLSKKGNRIGWDILIHLGRNPEHLVRPTRRLTFRSVELEGLTRILSNGIDVVPATAPFFCGEPDKALEYGGFPKLMMVLDVESLKRSWLEVPADIDAAQRASLATAYPTMLNSDDGRLLWFSTFPEKDSRCGTPYEMQYGYSLDLSKPPALLALIIFSKEPPEMPVDQPPRSA